MVKTCQGRSTPHQSCDPDYLSCGVQPPIVLLDHTRRDLASIDRSRLTPLVRAIRPDHLRSGRSIIHQGSLCEEVFVRKATANIWNRQDTTRQRSLDEKVLREGSQRTRVHGRGVRQFCAVK